MWVRTRCGVNAALAGAFAVAVLSACASTSPTADRSTASVAATSAARSVATTGATTGATIGATIGATSAPTAPMVPATTGEGRDPVASAVPSASPSSSAVVPDGFDAVRATATMDDGSVCELCLWLAATDLQRQQGLMHVTDLGGRDGMAFVYESPHAGNFWMKNTLMPLSIAFFDASGAYLDAFDMEPCTADPCPTYPTPTGFLVAVEAAQGTLAELGLAPGSALVVSDLPCA